MRLLSILAILGLTAGGQHGAIARFDWHGVILSDVAQREIDTIVVIHRRGPDGDPRR